MNSSAVARAFVNSRMAKHHINYIDLDLFDHACKVADARINDKNFDILSLIREIDELIGGL